MCLVLWAINTNYFVKFRPVTFLYGKKVNLTFIHAKRVFLNVVINGKKVGRTKKVFYTVTMGYILSRVSIVIAPRA